MLPSGSMITRKCIIIITIIIITIIIIIIIIIVIIDFKLLYLRYVVTCARLKVVKSLKYV